VMEFLPYIHELLSTPSLLTNEIFVVPHQPCLKVETHI
jgi:hypothetical protein